MADCLFCKIARGEIPSQKVRDTDRYFAFRDINPQAPVHILAIPKDHSASLEDIRDEAAIGGLMLFARDVARAEGLSEKGYRVILNTGTHGGQTVFHVHAHILGGRHMNWPPG